VGTHSTQVSDVLVEVYASIVRSNCTDHPRSQICLAHPTYCPACFVTSNCCCL
jgi:hypothetical protein